MTMSSRASTVVLEMHYTKLVKKTKDHAILKRGKQGPPQMPAIYQLMTLLHYFSNNGESNATQCNQFRISSGRTQLHRDRVVEALNSICSDWIHWSDANERVEIAKRVEKKSFFPNCVSMMDGTIFPHPIQPCSSDQ